jgi:hypothetical protein
MRLARCKSEQLKLQCSPGWAKSTATLAPSPLTIYHILVEGGDLRLPNASGDANVGDSNPPSQSIAPTGSPSPLPPPQPPIASRKVSIGAIVGGAVGGFVVILCIVLALLWSRKRRKTRQANADLHQPIAAFFGPIPPPAFYHKGLDTLASSQGGSTSGMVNA